MWNASFPAILVKYLLAAIRAASNAFEETYSLKYLFLNFRLWLAFWANHLKI